MLATLLHTIINTSCGHLQTKDMEQLVALAPPLPPFLPLHLPLHPKHSLVLQHAATIQ